MMWHSRRAGEGLAWCRLLHTRSCVSVDAVRGARGLEFVVRLLGAQIAVRSPMPSPAYIVIAALLPSHGNHQRKGSPSRRRATHVWDVLEPLAYANLTDIAGVQPTGSIEFTCGSRRASSSLRFSVTHSHSQLPLSALGSFAEVLWIISISRSNVSAMRG
jgi:hypothetical protein